LVVVWSESKAPRLVRSLVARHRVRAYPRGERRSFRTVALLCVLTVLNLFDLGFTHSQLPRGNFAEANFVAASTVDAPLAMSMYKLVLFGAGAAILYRYRRRWQSEAGLWLLVGCYSGLMVWWIAYLDAVEMCIYDVATVAPHVLF
jgi:hypothetical protein